MPTTLRSHARLFKHALDRMLALLAVVATAPLMSVVAVALQRRGGPVLDRDARVGEDGAWIALISFAITDEMCCSSRVWRRLAASGVRPLPQLWNVACGDLSLVGPRPRDLDSPPPPVRPGLTGLAQLEQLSRALVLCDELHLDDRYARTWSLALDARIIAGTLRRALR